MAFAAALAVTAEFGPTIGAISTRVGAALALFAARFVVVLGVSAGLALAVSAKNRYGGHPQPQMG